jgi:hypothetical protein
MNSTPHDHPRGPAYDPGISVSASSPAEETLRLISSLPAPAGLEERVRTALHRAPRLGRVLAWPRTLRPESGWMRSAAAAAIVFVVAGGGWGVYTRVDQTQPAKVIVMPARMPVSGGLTGLGAIRPPLTLPGPKAPELVKTIHAQPRTAKKPIQNHKAAGAGADPSAATGPATTGKTAGDAGAPR